MSTVDCVRDRLSESVTYRNDDRLLRLKVWEDFGFKLTKEQLEVYWSLPADGVISRRRREMRKEFPESKVVMEKRYNQFKEIREEKGNWLQKRFKSIIGSK